MCRCECEISAVLTERYVRTRDVPYGGHSGHGGHGGHGRRGAGRYPQCLFTALLAPITEGTALARRADVGRLRADGCGYHTAGPVRAKRLATRQAWREMGGAGRCQQPQRRQPPGGLLSPGLGGRDKKIRSCRN